MDDRVASLSCADNWRRLQEIRAVRDPDGLFVSYLAGPDGATNTNHWLP